MVNQNPLREWAEQPGNTYADLARRLDVSKGHVCDISKGRRKPSLRVALRIRDVLGVPVDYWASTAATETA